MEVWFFEKPIRPWLYRPLWVLRPCVTVRIECAGVECGDCVAGMYVVPAEVKLMRLCVQMLTSVGVEYCRGGVAVLRG